MPVVRAEGLGALVVGGLQPNRDKLVRRRTDGGVLRLQVQVCGDYAPGERELLQVLRLMGFARDFKGLYAGGVRSVADLLQASTGSRSVRAEVCGGRRCR